MSKGKNDCLLKVLGNLGYHIDTNRSGPFWAMKDGHDFPQDHGKVVRPVRMTPTTAEGDFVMFHNCHFKSLRLVPEMGDNRK